MKKISKALIKISALLFISTALFGQPVNQKYQKWVMPSYFRGYNVIDEVPKTIQDFVDLKNYGGNFFSINTRGFFSEDAPYDFVDSNITSVDTFVSYCRQAGIYYNIAVRSGPGAYDTFFESEGLTPESRIWNTGNITEQQKYADMLKFIVNRYLNDSLFVGITLVVEPRPKVTMIPANTSELYKIFLENVFNIHMDDIYNFWISEIRTIDPELPIVVENFAYSTPELFPPYEVNDEFVIYSTHNYQPVQYTREDNPFTVTYPGVYWNITFLSQQLYDSAFMANTIFTKVNQFKQLSGKPVLLGEFGMIVPQNGGPQYINDVLSIIKSSGWHFALWDWRRGNNAAWDMEGFIGDNKEHWKTVLDHFHPPPVPGLISPFDGEEVTTLTPLFIWDSLTSYTSFDLIVTDSAGRKLFTVNDITNARYLYDGPALVPGETYGWVIRSKNPNGTEENISAWSAISRFRVSDLLGIANSNNIPKEFRLYQNYPNPFNPVTLIKYDLPKSSFVTIRIFDITGRQVKELVNGFKNAGSYRAEFNASQLASGVYYYKIETEYSVDTRKMILLK